MKPQISQISLAEIKLTLLAAKVKYEKLEDAITWAFGSTQTPIKEWVTKWNELHKDIFEMTGSDTIFDTVYKIGRAYSQKNKKKTS